jgi:deoxyribonuclease IV
MLSSPLLGTHVSVSGGIHTAFERASSIGCSTMQLFVKNANRWAGKPLGEHDVQSYKSAGAGARVAPVVAHAAYLINLCAVQPETLIKSRRGFEDELRRCEALGIFGLVVHPGAHMGAGEEEGIRRIADSLNSIHERTSGFRTLSILEVTAGQGTAIGYRFDHLGGIMDLLRAPERAAICLDTCHAFAAGYDLRTDSGWETMLHEFDATIGLSQLAVIHVNDSMKELGSRKDRHEHIGKGRIGLDGFRFLMNDPRFDTVPKILETDKSEDMHEDVENMNLLRSLIRVTP